MANQKKRKPAARKKQVEKDEGLKPYENEIIIVVTLVVCILLILSNFHMCGIVGAWVSRIFFGLFGFMNYIVPLGVFMGMAFYLSNKGSKKARRKLISILLFMVVLMALLQSAYQPYVEGRSFMKYYEVSSESRLGGGLVGGTFNGVLCHFFGGIGSVVILLGMGILLCMFISEKLFFAPMGKRGYEKMQKIKETRKHSRELQESKVEEKPQTKRKAKTFVIPKEAPAEKSIENQSTEKMTKGHTKKEKALKREKKTPVDMEEITPSGIDTMSIVRAQTPKENGSMPVYEEELMQKFKPVHAKAHTDISELDSIFDESFKQQEKEIVKETSKKIKKEDKKVEPVKGQEDSFIDIGLTKETQTLESYDARVPEETTFTETVVIEPSVESQRPSVAPAVEEITSPVQTEKLEKEHQHVEKAAEKELPKAEQQGESVGIVEPVPYVHPSLELLSLPKDTGAVMSDEELKSTALKLHRTLESFGVHVTITNVSCGPSVTRYELHPEQGVKVSKITGLADDIKLNLAAADLRIEAPIPGKAAVGIEVPNKVNSPVLLRELLESKEFKKHSSNIAFSVGKDIAGKTVVTDIAKMPHLLIAGATGSGKSVCINTLIMSILYKSDPKDVKLIMIDPKVVELSVYNGIPHLLIPVVTDPKKASAALNWAVAEMTERYDKFSELGVRDLKGYNAKIAKLDGIEQEEYQYKPEIVIIVDELADLMMVAPGEVEEAICRLAQLARAAGLHLVIATQRPSVNVITGVIKANIPSRIAFSVSSAVDSRTILDGAGAEKLLGRGDMLFYPAGFPKPIRVQGAFVSDQEVSAVVEFLTRDVKGNYDNSIVEKITTQEKTDGGIASPANDRDEYFNDAARFIVEKDKASIGMLQRVFRIGFNRASRIMEQLNDAGVVGDDEGTKPRKVTMTMEELEEMIGQ